ncbi:MAG: hypothetical protein PSY14_01320 [bacterium]|nr:hypothetical protein [bacterium]
MADNPLPEDGKPPKDVFKDFLDAASKKAGENQTHANEQAALKSQKDALRAELLRQCNDAKDGMRERYEGHIHPILSLLETLPEKDGKKFHVKVAFSDGNIDEAVEALDEILHDGPTLTITVRYDKDWGKEVASQTDIHPMIKVVLEPVSYRTDDDISVTRFDKLSEDWDIGGGFTKKHDESSAYGYDSLREALGEWLADNAPDRIADIVAAKDGPPPKGPTLPPATNKYKGGALRP